jgi:succinate-acetate transporter protein
MEAGRLGGAGAAGRGVGAREADVAPAPDPTAGRGAALGWTPADPGPLGLAGFAATTFMLSVMNANLVSFSKGLPVVFGMALAYGGVAQLIAGIWEFRTGNTFGAVAFCSYGAFWISFFILAQIDLKAIPKDEVNSALGLYLWTWAIFTFLMFIASLRTTGAIALVFLLLGVTYVFLAIGNSGASANTIKIGGWLGIATAAAAWYAALAAVVNSVFGRAVLPVFSLSRA